MMRAFAAGGRVFLFLLLLRSSGVCLAQVPDDFVSRPFTELNDRYWYSGDTFSLKVVIKNGTRSQHFCLYGINTPEPDSTREGELTADSARFRLSRAEVMAWGERVKQVVRRTLQEGGTIYTRRDAAGTIGGRDYAHAMVYDARGRDLAVLLLEAGYAAVDEATGANRSPNHPLNRAQKLAVREQRGIWAQARRSIPAVAVPPPAVRGGGADPLPALNGQTWTVYEDGRLAREAYGGDGDSFALTGAHGRATVWRLYGVDCPETSHQVPQRVQAQAAYYGISRESVLMWGKRAAAFTEKFLQRGPAMICTVKEDARGSGAKRRYYALIRVKGEDLSLALVREGLASCRSKRLPGRSRDAMLFHQALEQAEQEARQARRGIWQDSRKE